ncbi:MAG TPA: acetyl-CoA carboxylase, carboxyltransferase subunit beta [Dissulfurispiraceae bacterium]|nr:acetyl-CoA carboxylase, carboxyltransferase subunit beta [Dissulfurispiraceae bacterium]
MSWFKKRKDIKAEKKVKIPEGLWIKCDSCKEIIYKKEIEKNLQVCPKCNYHFRISARERISYIADEGSFIELDSDMSPTDPLAFRDEISYMERLDEYRHKSDISEAVIYGDAGINTRPVVLAIMDFSFWGGSMGSVVGEKITRAAERALEKKVPLIVVSASGGARMQEGMFSLMQMAKVSAAIAKLRDSDVLYISILADPTFGGVTASFAMLGDIIMAEPKSLIGFAGQRVIEQTIKQQLPDNFQRAEFLLEHGMIDLVVERRQLKDTAFKLIEHFMPIPREQANP